MNNALYVAATGLQAQQLNLDTTAANLANISTPGYKAAQVAFEQLMSGSALAAGAAARGVQGTVMLRDLGGTELTESASSFDVAIRGQGFIEVQNADGTRAYSRGGRLSLTADSTLALGNGHELARPVQMPSDCTDLRIDPDGRVYALGGGREPREIGQLDLVVFANPGALRPLGDGLYAASEATGMPVAGRAGEAGFGTLAQKYVESSNVKMLDEMMNLMMAQRAYQLNAKLLETADEVMAMTNNLRRG